MSAEDGKLNQHLVPQAHLLRFTDAGGKLNVHKFMDDGTVRVYRTGTKNVSAEINYYDDNPYDDKSIETFLMNQEKRGQPSVDKVLESRADIHVNRSVVKYVLMLLGRTLPFAITNYDCSPPEFHLTDDDERHFRQTSIFDAMSNPLMQDAEDMLCCHIRKEGDLPFVTSDVPVAMMSLDLEKDLRIGKEIGQLPPLPPDPNDPAACERVSRQLDMLRDAFRDTILVCPLSPNVCTVVYHRSVTDIMDKLRKVMSPNTVFVINSMIIHGAVENVYSNIPLNDYVEMMKFGNRGGPGADVQRNGDHSPVTRDVQVPAILNSMLLEIRFDRMNPEIADRLGRILHGFRRMDDTELTEPNGQPVTVHRFDSDDGSEHVMASVRHLAIVADNSDRIRFSQLAKTVSEEFISEFGIEKLVRIGFRMGFVMKPSALLNRGPLAMFTPVYAELFRAPSSTSHLGRVIREFHTQARIMNRAIVSTPTLPDGEVGAEVDVDSFIEGIVPTDNWWKVVEELSDSNVETLRGAIPKELHKRLGIKG